MGVNEVKTTVLPVEYTYFFCHFGPLWKLDDCFFRQIHSEVFLIYFYRWSMTKFHSEIRKEIRCAQPV